MIEIVDTFVLVAPDCPVSAAVVPGVGGPRPSVASIQHELLTARPRELTLEDLIFETHLRRAGLARPLAPDHEAEIRADLFSRPHPCMRASTLAKRHGWGVHHDEAGRMTLHAVESASYRRFAEGAVEGVVLVKAMRTKRAV